MNGARGRLGPRLVDRALDRARLRRAPGRPRQVHLSVTDRCFLPCLHCDIWKNTTPDLPTEVWSEVIDRLGEWCAPGSMNFVGGEPLLRKDLEQLMGQAVDQTWAHTAARAAHDALPACHAAVAATSSAARSTWFSERGMKQVEHSSSPL